MPFSGIKLLIASPFYEIKAFVPYDVSMDLSKRLLDELGVEHTWMPVCGDSYPDRVKNTIVHRFLESDFTDLMMIDSDLEWSFDAIGRLLSVPYEVVGGDFPMKNNWENYISRIYCDSNGRPVLDPAGTGLIKAEWLPGGFLRLKKSCIEKMYEAYKQDGYHDPLADPEKPNRWYAAIINCEIRKGLRYTEDVNFCRKWQEIGGDIWLDPNITFSHYGIKGWTGNYHEFLLRQPGGSKVEKKLDLEIINYTNFTIPPMDFIKAAEIMKEGYFRLQGMTKWVSAGTALGLFRNNEFIEGDTDIDVAVLGYLGIDDQIKAAFHDYELIRSGYYKGFPMQLAFRKNGIVFDVFFHWKEGENYINHSELGITRVPCRIYDNPVKLGTKYGPFDFPNPPEEYMMIRYGADWRTPKDEKPRFF